MRIEILPSLIFSPQSIPSVPDAVRLYRDISVSKFEWLAELATPAYVNAFEDAGLHIETLITGWEPFYQPMIGSDSQSERERGRDWLKLHIDQARELGARFLGGAFGYLTGPRESAFTRFCDEFTQLIDYADGDVILLVEKMRHARFPGYTWEESVALSQLAKQTTTIMRDLDHITDTPAPDGNPNLWTRPLPHETEQYWQVYENYHKPLASRDISVVGASRWLAHPPQKITIVVELFYNRLPIELEQIKRDIRASMEYVRQATYAPTTQ
jgi:hypothetical protein